MPKSPSLLKKLKSFAQRIGGTTVVDNEADPNSALNKLKGQPTQAGLSWQARGVQQGLAKTYANTKGKTFGTNLK